MVRRVLLVIALVAGCAACGASSTSTLHVEHTGSITWTPCGDVQCASLSVPLNAARPNGAHITLALARRPASGRPVGVLFTNPGGPGASGVAFLRDATKIFRPDILQRFDLVSWDPRGVGASAPVRCLDNLDEFYALDRNPQDGATVARNVAVSRQFVDACRKHSGFELAYLSTDASARDMDAIRAAMGEPTISYIGFSYGTYLGALYADRYPQRVRAMALDGAVDPSVSYDESTITQAEGFERAFDAFVRWCRSHDECQFARGGDPGAAFDSLASTIAAEPEPGTVDGEHRTLGPGEFDIGVASALYDGEEGYESLANALAQAARGTGDELLHLSDMYTQRDTGGRYSNETAALYAISCVDGGAPRTLTAVKRLAIAAARVAPRFGAATVWLGLPCSYWPAPATADVRPVHAVGSGPILVVGNTGDPATPYVWAQSLAHQLHNGHLLTYVSTGHTAYARGSSCIDTAVDAYLLTLTLPTTTTC